MSFKFVNTISLGNIDVVSMSNTNNHKVNTKAILYK